MRSLMRAVLMSLCGLCFWAGPANARVILDGTIVPDEANVIYGDCPVIVDGVEVRPNQCVMDLYKPEGSIERVLVFVHGGLWMDGSKDNLREAQALLEWFTQRGYMVAGVGYRQVFPNPLVTPNPGPKVVNYTDSAADVAQAVAWVVANRDIYHVHHKEPVVLGFSSGAHIVSLITGDPSYLDAAGSKNNKFAAQILIDDDAYDIPLALESISHNLWLGLKLKQGVPATCSNNPPTPNPGACFVMLWTGLGDNIKVINYVIGSTPEEHLAGSPYTYLPAAKHVPPTYLLSADAQYMLSVPSVATPTEPPKPPLYTEVLVRGVGVSPDFVPPPQIVQTLPLPLWWYPTYTEDYWWSKGKIAYDTTEAYYNLLIAAGVDATHVHLDQRDHTSLVTRFVKDTQDGETDQGPSDGVQQFLDRLGL